MNRVILTDHHRFGAYALPGAFYPDDDVLARAAEQGGRRGRPTAERLRPIRRTITGLFNVNDDEHRRHRRLLQPETWRPGENRDVHADMTSLTLRIATKTLFGSDAGERGVALAHMMQEWLVTMFSLGMVVRLDVGPLPYSRWLDLTRRIDDETAAILREKRALVEKSGDGAIAADMLSMLIAARDEDGSALDEDELIGHVGAIFGAGHETSTNALAWTLFLLAEHPEVANDLVDELTGVLRGGAPTVEQLGKLPFLDAVVKESLRLLPPEKNSEVFLSIIHAHHDPAVYEQPRRFLPSRWSTIKPSAYEYLPFSAGPRMCIGAAFASMEIKTALAMLLQRFRVERLDNVRVDHRVAITMAPKNGLRMRIRSADGQWASARRSLPSVRGKIREIMELPT